MGSSPSEIRRVQAEWNVPEILVDPETPDHAVEISKPFLIGKYDVTVGQFKQFVSETGYKTVAETQGWGWGYDNLKKHWTKKNGLSWRNPGFQVYDDYPVTMVCHVDAEAFCNWLSSGTVDGTAFLQRRSGNIPPGGVGMMNVSRGGMIIRMGRS